MANESSTKPTYSELEAERDQLKIDNEALESNLEAEEADNKRLEAENLRVRGLLQRAKRLLHECLPQLYNPTDIKAVRSFLAESPNPCSTVASKEECAAHWQGAESADIGKLDSADEKADV